MGRSVDHIVDFGESAGVGGGRRIDGSLGTPPKVFTQYPGRRGSAMVPGAEAPTDHRERRVPVSHFRDQAPQSAACHHACHLRAVHHAGRSGDSPNEHLVFPVFHSGYPLGSKYRSTCTLCGVSVKLDKAQALQMVAAAQQVATQSPGVHIPQPESLAPPPSTSPLVFEAPAERTGPTRPRWSRSRHRRSRRRYAQLLGRPIETTGNVHG